MNFFLSNVLGLGRIWNAEWFWTCALQRPSGTTAFSVFTWRALCTMFCFYVFSWYQSSYSATAVFLTSDKCTYILLHRVLQESLDLRDPRWDICVSVISSVLIKLCELSRSVGYAVLLGLRLGFRVGFRHVVVMVEVWNKIKIITCLEFVFGYTISRQN